MAQSYNKLIKFLTVLKRYILQFDVLQCKLTLEFVI